MCLVQHHEEARVVPSGRYELRSSEEDRKQLYWGAFMLGAAAFQEHRKAGYWLDERALEALALRGFQLLAVGGDDLPEVDDRDLGRRYFREGFIAGYQERAARMGVESLERRT